MEHADGVLDGGFSSHTLDGLDDNLLGFLVGIELSLVHDLIDVAGGSSLGLIFHRLDETVLGILSTESRDFLKHLALFELHLLEFLGLDRKQTLLIVETLLLGVEFTTLAAEFLLTLVERELTLLQFVLSLLSLLVTLLDLLLELALLVEELLLDFQQFLLLDNLSLLVGGFDHLIVFSLQYEAENQISADSTQNESAGSDQ